MTRLVSHPWLHGIVLVLGALLVGVAGLFHPILSGDGAAQLTAIGSTAGWRLIHWSISFGYVLAVAGLSALAAFHSDGPAGLAARIGVSLTVFGYAVSLVAVLFMLGSANALAHTFREAARSSDAVVLYGVLHPFVLGALRVGTFAVSLGIAALGVALEIGHRLPRWIARLGIAAGAIGAILAVLLDEQSPAIIAGIGLAVIWQLVVGTGLLAMRRE